MGMGCNTLCFSPHSPLPITSFRPKRTLSCCATNYIDKWVNPKKTRSFDEVQIIRHWVGVEPNPSIPSTCQERFTMVSHNVLAVRNASKHSHLYPFVPSEYMSWDRRKRLLCDEFIQWDSDIICLQEVDRYYDLLEIMEKEGYVGSYKRRTGDTVDGCAMFWKGDKFRLLEEDSIQFKEFGLRDNVAQISVFEMCRANPRRVVVGNTHVLFSPNRGDIKLGQIRLLLSRACILSKKWGGAPVVLAGDLNSTPQSPLYQFLSSSELDVTLYEKRYLSGQHSCSPSQSGGSQGHMTKTVMVMERFLRNYWTEEELITATGNTDGIADHPLKLKSSYASVRETEGSTETRDSYGEPLATSFHSKFLGTVDYLWYSEGLVPTRVLDTPPINILRKTQGLPHKKLGSDHLALVSEFAFTHLE